MITTVTCLADPPASRTTAPDYPQIGRPAPPLGGIFWTNQPLVFAFSPISTRPRMASERDGAEYSTISQSVHQTIGNSDAEKWLGAAMISAVSICERHTLPT